MRTLEFKVSEQMITKREGCDFSKIVAGSSGYLRAKFYFLSGSWRDCIKAASFWMNGQEHAAVLDDNDMCMIPPEALTDRSFHVSVLGIRPETDYRITTNKIKVRQEVA